MEVGESLIPIHHARQRRRPPPFSEGGGWLLVTGLVTGPVWAPGPGL